MNVFHSQTHQILSTMVIISVTNSHSSILNLEFVSDAQQVKWPIQTKQDALYQEAHLHQELHILTIIHMRVQKTINMYTTVMENVDSTCLAMKSNAMAIMKF